ncbi:methionine--tRNA ligase [Dactylosporangium sp. NPDC049525]|uniref:methionine--tRNA ligase n=1 Tax=Dactylosporangium sp. NPDC049525 TaxID=3154730 RepID=UPI00343C0E74
MIRSSDRRTGGPGRVFTGVAWPGASGPRHLGHVAGFGVPSDIFSRYQRMAGNQVLMISGTSEHGTAVLLEADRDGVAPRQVADRYSRVIAEDLQAMGLSFDLFTRTTTRNHYAVTQQVFRSLLNNGYVSRRTVPGAISPSTGRPLPDRCIEGTCPVCAAPAARADQCGHCGNLLDPADLIDPRSSITGEALTFAGTEHFFLDLPAFAEVLGGWLQSRDGWRSNVLKCTLDLLDDLRPRAISRDLDWGVPIPLDGWVGRPDKRLCTWFDTVIGYLSGSVEWARRTGDPDLWRAWWHDPATRGCYFMGKDDIAVHSVMWPSILLGQNGTGDRGGRSGTYGLLQLPQEVVSSEVLTMQGHKGSAPRDAAVYVTDVLSRYSADALRYYLAACGPETSDTDFTWSEFVRRTNDELVAGWGNLVHRVVSLAHRNFGAVPEAESFTPADVELLTTVNDAFDTVGELLDRHRHRAALNGAMQTVAAVDAYVTQEAPWTLRDTDRARMGTQLHVMLQAVQDCNALLTPFVPAAANRVHALLGGAGTWVGMPQLRDVEDGTRYTVLMGDYQGAARWGTSRIRPGTPLEAPVPVFTKLDPALVEGEVSRLRAG